MGRKLDRAQPHEHARPAARLGGSSERAGALERLLGAAELDEQARAVGLERRRQLGEAALLAEGDPLLEVGERAGRPLERVAGDGEVVLQDGSCLPAPCSMSRASARSISARPSGSPR